jgi:hypothetical protein
LSSYCGRVTLTNFQALRNRLQGSCKACTIIAPAATMHNGECIFRRVVKGRRPNQGCGVWSRTDQLFITCGSETQQSHAKMRVVTRGSERESFVDGDKRRQDDPDYLSACTCLEPWDLKLTALELFTCHNFIIATCTEVGKERHLPHCERTQTGVSS